MNRPIHRSMRVSGIASAAVAGLALAAGPAFAAAGAAGPMVSGSATAPADTVVTSKTWFGYAAYSGTYTSVESTWVQPTVDCSKGGGEATFWVGLDGATNGVVQQTGTRVFCPLVGQPSYSAWWETFPSNIMQQYTDTVRPGDTFTAKVTFVGDDEYDLYLADTTQGWTEDRVEKGASGAANTSAEIVGETPQVIPDYVFYNLPYFGTMNFTDSKVNGLPLADSNPSVLNLGRFGHTLATTGSLSNGTDFTETWLSNS